MALEVVKMGTGHLARANGAIDGPYCIIAHQPGPVCLESGGRELVKAMSVAHRRRPTADGRRPTETEMEMKQ